MQRCVLVVLTLLVGCADVADPPTRADTENSSGLAESFDIAATGAIEGRVTWDGPVPVADETVVRVSAYNPFLHQKPARFMTPHVPLIESKTHGVANAVVFLKLVDPRRSRPWDHGKARVEFRDREMGIVQGDVNSAIGFVRKGDAIGIVNQDGEYHVLRARGADFFAMPLSEAGRVHKRALARTGVVDLTCSAGYYWTHAHLFVTDHPYYTRTSADGRFTLAKVPTGVYEVVCWLPSWHRERTERDPETAAIARIAWRAPKEQTQTVRVEAGRITQITYQWDAVMFGVD